MHVLIYCNSHWLIIRITYGLIRQYYRQTFKYVIMILHGIFMYSIYNKIYIKKKTEFKAVY
jgi:hypothetical protein